jgi:hypothetical protein
MTDERQVPSGVFCFPFRFFGSSTTDVCVCEAAAAAAAVHKLCMLSVDIVIYLLLVLGRRRTGEQMRLIPLCNENTFDPTCTETSRRVVIPLSLIRLDSICLFSLPVAVCGYLYIDTNIDTWIHVSSKCGAVRCGSRHVFASSLSIQSNCFVQSNPIQSNSIQSNPILRYPNADPRRM